MIDEEKQEQIAETVTAEAARHMKRSGWVSPLLIAMNHSGSGFDLVWSMNVMEAFAMGDQGVEELRRIAGRVTTAAGCDLSRMGVKEDHFKADVTAIVFEGKGTASNSTESFRVVSMEFFGYGKTWGLLLKVEGSPGVGITMTPMGWAQPTDATTTSGQETLH